MDAIFTGSGIGTNRAYAYDGEEDTYTAAIKARIADAVDYEESHLQLAREENQAYYYGELPGLGNVDEADQAGDDEQPNKSTFVSTDVRDTILSILPSLLRIFTSAEHVAEFVPNTEEQEPMAKQAYLYVNYVFYEENDGFLSLHSVFKDALTVRTGIMKWWTDTDDEVEEQTFTNITAEQYQFLISEMPEVEVVDLEGGQDGVINSLTLRYYKSVPLTKAAPVPPEEFRVSRYAKTVDTADLIGHERVVPVSDLVKKGYDLEDIRNFVTRNDNSMSEERLLRNPALVDDYSGVDGVLYGEWYIRIDGDGDGVDELRYICTIGDNYQIVEDHIVPHHNFAVFQCDPRPHTVVGDAITDLVKDIQRIKTFMARGLLDNLAESTNPKTVINELTTNIDDALNDEVGAVIRTRGNVNEAVAFSRVPFVGDDLQANIDYFDKVRASRTGITEASKGLDPRAMQSTALSGIDAIVQGAQERIELIARVLAETGLRPLLRGLLREVVNNPNQARTVKLTGTWVKVNPSLYDPGMRVKVNPTLGKGSDMIRLQALSEVQATQQLVIEKFGVKNNPLCGPIEFRNTLVDKLELVNIRNASRYFKPIDPQVMAAIDASPNEPDPASVLAQAELEKNKKDVVIAIGEQEQKKASLDFQREKLAVDDDFRRDKLNVDAAVDAIAALKGIQEQLSPQKGLLSLNTPDAE